MAKNNKEEVLNPITLFNTVGQEITEILSANDKDFVSFMNFMNWEGDSIQSIKKISKSDAKKIGNYLAAEEIENYLLSFQEDYKLTETKALETAKKHKLLYNKVKHLTPLLRNEFNNGIDVLADISEFLDIDDELEIPQKATAAIALYRIAGFKPDSLNLFAWMRRGLLDFNNLELPSYNKQGLEDWIEKGEWKNYLTNVEYFKNIPNILKQFGVGLILTPYLPKTVYGAVRWVNNRPLIQISDRDRSLAVCWYTFFHEIGHVLLHENDVIFEGEINETKAKANLKERQANQYAYGLLTNGDGLRKFIFSYKIKPIPENFISEIASEFSTIPMFVAYWLKKAQKAHWSINSYIPKIAFESV